MDKEWTFYIVRCKDNSLYSGVALNVDDRVKAHNRGAGAKYTRSRGPVTLVYTEKYDNDSQARKREAQVKKLSKVKKEQLILGSTGPDTD